MIARILLIVVLCLQMIAPALPSARSSVAAAEPCCCGPEVCRCEECGCAADDDSGPQTPAPVPCTTSLRETTWTPLQTDGFTLPAADAMPMRSRGLADALIRSRLPNEVSLARVCVRMT